jgi:DNA-binding transcriptional regulator YdaS (Cro superfamily)
MKTRVGLEALAECVRVLGSQKRAGEVCGVGQTAISECLRNAKRVPAEWCRPLEEATAQAGERITAHQLRPDLFAKPESRKARKRAASTAEARA